MLSLGALNATMVGTLIAGILSFSLTIYSIYLNYRQAKVKEQMDELIAVTKEINTYLHNSHNVNKKATK